MNNIEVPLSLVYNNIMLIKNREVGEFSKIDNKIELNRFSEWWSRGERGIDCDYNVECDLNKVVMFWENSDDGEDCERGIELNNVEEMIVIGDGGFIDGCGFESCIDRVEKILDGESIIIEGEEGMWCIGSKRFEEVEIDYMKFKIEMLKG